MKLHVSACEGHRQVSTTIKKSLYICVRTYWWRDLFRNMLYSNNETTCFGLWWPSSGFYND